MALAYLTADSSPDSLGGFYSSLDSDTLGGKSIGLVLGRGGTDCEIVVVAYLVSNQDAITAYSS